MVLLFSGLGSRFRCEGCRVLGCRFLEILGVRVQGCNLGALFLE